MSTPSSRNVAHARRETKDQVIAAVLAGGQSQAAAADAAGVTTRTVQRRMADPEFRRRVDDARGDLLGRTLDVLGAGSLEAAVVLRQTVMDGNESSNVRLAACRTLLQSVIQWRDQIEIAARIDAIEQRIEHRAGPVGLVR